MNVLKGKIMNKCPEKPSRFHSYWMNILKSPEAMANIPEEEKGDLEMAKAYAEFWHGVQDWAKGLITKCQKKKNTAKVEKSSESTINLYDFNNIPKK